VRQKRFTRLLIRAGAPIPGGQGCGSQMPDGRRRKTTYSRAAHRSGL